MVVRSAFFNLAMFFGVCLFNFYKVEIVGGWFFQQIGPLGQFGPEVVMSVRLCTYVSPSHAIFLCPWTGAEGPSSVDWCVVSLALAWSPKNGKVF